MLCLQFYRACRGRHIEVATRLIARVDDPKSILLKGSLSVLHLMARKIDLTHLDILDALHKKYPNLQQCITPEKDDDIAHNRTPMSFACQFYNDKLLQWVLRCFNNTLTVISLFNAGLTGKLPLKLFEFTNLKVLNVSKNKLTGISEVDDCVAFICGELEKAVFSDNEFTVIPKGLFLLLKLNELNFSKNKVKELNLDGIEVHKIPLVKLNVSGNVIKAVPQQLFCLPYLEELNLDDNQITKLPEKIWFAPRLNQLNINSNLLTELPVPNVEDEGDVADDESDSTASSYISVKSHFSQSYRETMMATGEMIEIEEFDIRAKQLYGLHLKKLELNKNKLQVIPPNLPCLAPFLQTLSIADNELNVTPCIKNLPQLLKRLDFSRNKLTKFLPKTLAQNKIPPLKKCPISQSNKCNHFSHEKLNKLEYLDMSHNNIDDNINTRHDILYFEKLSKLNLSNNQLKKFPDFVLHQSFLSELNISNNPGITTIPCELSRLENLRSFKCDGISDPAIRLLNKLNTSEMLEYLRSRMKRYLCACMHVCMCVRVCVYICVVCIHKSTSQKKLKQGASFKM